MFGYIPPNEFYITLLSNNSMNRFPKNVQSAFTNYIDPPIILTPGEWYVGITEIFHNKFIPAFQNLPADSTVLVNKNHVSVASDESLVFSPEGRSRPAYDMMYIYSDIISERIIGDQQTRCLKVLPTLTKPEQMIRFGRVEYYQVDVNHLRSISIRITDEEGDQIDFKRSVLPTMVTLHFKKKTI